MDNNNMDKNYMDGNYIKKNHEIRTTITLGIEKKEMKVYSGQNQNNLYFTF